MPLRGWQTVIGASGIALTALAAALPASAGSATPDGPRTTVEGSRPAWATPTARVGPADQDAVRHIHVAVSLRDKAGAARLATAVSTPNSREHGRFLNPQQFADRFAATPETLDQIRTWLSDQGLRVTGMASNRHFIDAEAKTSTIEHAFGTTLSRYRHSVAGHPQELVAPSAPITLPARLKGSVDAVLGLDDSTRTLRPQHIANRPATGNAAGGQHCARWWGEQNNTAVPQKYPGKQSNSLCGYSGSSIRAMYGLGKTNTGRGTTIGIVGAYNAETVAADTNRAAAQLGVPPLKPGQYGSVLPSGGFTDQQECDVDGWGGEQALDVSATHAVAPQAGLRYYAAHSCVGNGLYAAFNQAVSENKVDVITNSWGDANGEKDLPASVRDQFNSMALQAAIQGQSVTASTGDTGDNSGQFGHPTADYPASTPWVTAVGGTSVGLGQGNEPKVLAGWENSGNSLSGGKWVPQRDTDGPFAGGSGGGRSGLYGAPDWQKGVVPSSPSGGRRATPDISALADSYTGMLVGHTDTSGQFSIASYGGTSLAAPLIAGMAADAQQIRPGAKRAGLLNPALYQLARDHSKAITDVTPQHAGVWSPAMHAMAGTSVPSTPGSYLIDFDQKPQSLQTAPGWDPVTGVGTPASGFVTELGR
ncbi:S53 family peptidase [Sciscionella marina]|uniref:S53 family peptidase n=1 Tax=Sciscionella marina TaxID=508770 RepID=UPI000A04FE09|nr:S53 family peptidase [Sciscionella marina]